MKRPAKRFHQVSRWRIIGRGRRHDRAEELPRAGDGGAPLPIGEEAEVPDAHEAAREHVQEKATEEFVDAERHDLCPSAIGVVLPAEPHDAVGEADQPRVRDRNPMRVAPEVLQDLRRSPKRPLRIDHPGRRFELADQRGEARGRGERGRPGGEGQITVGERVVQRLKTFRAEDAGERLHRKQIRRASADPPRAVVRQGAPGDETVDVQTLPPAPTIP